MTSRELQQKFDISQDVLYFYERNGFVQSERSGFQKNYEKEDVQALKKLILLQRLGIPYTQIESLYDGEKMLAEVVTAHKEELENDRNYQGVYHICDMIVKENDYIDSMDVDRYWDLMDSMKDEGQQFFEQSKKGATRRKIKKAFFYGALAPFLMIIMALFMHNISKDIFQNSSAKSTDCEVVYAQFETGSYEYSEEETISPYFNEIWASTDPLKRYLLLDQLFHTYDLIGMSLNEVEDVLGVCNILNAPNDQESAYADELRIYEVKYDDEDGIECFVLYFKDGIVSHYKMTFFSEL